MPSIIGADLKVVGNLVCEGDIDVQGTVKGDIEAKTVTIDKNARVDGAVRARSLIVSGSVDGSVEASEVSLTSTAQVAGELVHETLSVDPGACVEARLSRISKERQIAAQIPKPKLEPREPEPSKAEADKTAPAPKTAESPVADDAADERTDPSQSGTSPIPEVFDRRKKQATG